MAAVTKATTIRPLQIPGYEYNDKAQAAAAIARGDLVVITTGTPGSGFDHIVTIAPTTALRADGIALKAAASGSQCEYGIVGEMEYGSGMTPATFIYPSATTAGQADTTEPTGGVEQIRVVNATRIRYNFTV